MLAKQVAAAIEAARPSQLDEISRTLWKGLAAGVISEAEGDALAAAIETRRAVVAAQKPAARRVGSRPRSAASLERRRRWVAAGLLPPQIACQFTMGEAGALALVAAEAQRRGRCELTVGAIAATAGVCATTVRNALRRARQLGLLAVEERRVSWTRNLPNVVRILALEWLSWLRLGAKGGGCKSVRPTPTAIIRKRFAPFAAQRKEGGKQGWPPERSVSGSAKSSFPSRETHQRPDMAE
jgi:hypothetical protein